MLDEASKQKFRQRLLEEQGRLQAELEQEDREFKEMTSDQGNENAYSNHMDDVGSQLQEMARISSMQDNVSTLLKQVRKALQRLDNGTYGLSEVSGKEIPLERLEAVPYATRLVDEEA